MRLSILLAALSVVAALSGGSQGTIAPGPCFPACMFTFCDPSGSPVGNFEIFQLGQPDVPFTGSICHEGEIVGRVGSTGEAYVQGFGIRGPRVVPLSDVGLGFSTSFFKSFDIVSDGPMKSGIGHEVPQGDQLQFFDSICVGVPIGRYQVLNDDGFVIGNKQGSDPLTDCVAFRALD